MNLVQEATEIVKKLSKENQLNMVTYARIAYIAQQAAQQPAEHESAAKSEATAQQAS